jgi:hypothetical protein
MTSLEADIERCFSAGGNIKRAFRFVSNVCRIASDAKLKYEYNSEITWRWGGKSIWLLEKSADI